MYEQLSQYLDDNATPEQSAVVIRACQILNESGVEEHLTHIDQALMLVDSLHDDAVFHITENILKPIFKQRLAEFSVVVNAEADLKQTMTVFENIRNIEFFEDMQSINDAVQSDENPEDVLSDILALISGEQSLYFMEILESVDPELLENIAEVSSNKLELASVPLVDPASIALVRARLNSLRLKHSDLLADAMSAEGYKIGTPFNLLIAGRHDQLNEYKAQILAIQLVSIAILACVEPGEMVKTVGFEIDALELQALQITQIQTYIRKLAEELTNVTA